MRILFTDLDNTLIYSYKHAIGSAKRCAEIYQGREISFLTLSLSTLQVRKITGMSEKSFWVRIISSIWLPLQTGIS